jgi:hypothetical protein
MGLLDDAIRDHLDLKRRHGADPAELERAEREALGPVRRKGDVAATGYADDDEAVEEPFELDDEDAPAGSRPVAYDQAEDDWDYDGDEALAVEQPEASEEPVDPEPPRRRSRRSLAHSEPEPEAAESDAEQDQPRGLAARFGLRGRRTEHHDDAEPEPDEPPGEDEPTRVHRAERTDRSPAPTGDETAEHDVERELHHDEADADDDMLEETPEFLQDAPDHDQLWFEQKPPRDFDFDG